MIEFISVIFSIFVQGFFSICNQFHILRLFNELPNFPFTTSEVMGDYYLKTWYLRVESRVAKQLKT